MNARESGSFGRAVGHLRLGTLAGILLLGAPWRAAAQVDGQNSAWGGPDSAGTRQTGQVEPFSGAFVTEIPIEVPPYYGIEPRIALVYSSSGSNGVVGVGWDLRATSYITRASPGKGAPRYDASDIYLLDGMELVLVQSDIGGGAYATRIQDYRRIFAGSSGGDWGVYDKDGTRSWYTSPWTTPAGNYLWPLRLVENSFARRVEYEHEADEESGRTSDLNLKAIRYGGVEVTFFYEVRPDPVIRAIGGSQLAITRKRLRSIFVKRSSSVIRAYRLSYDASTTTGRSLLVKVERFGTDVQHDGVGGITGGSALPPAEFTWSAPRGGTAWGELPAGERWYMFPDAEGPEPQVRCGDGDSFIHADFTGDGKTDILLIDRQPNYGTQYWVLKSTGSGFAGANFWGNRTSGARTLVGDFNGDGRTDVLEVQGGYGALYVQLSTGGSFAECVEPWGWSDWTEDGTPITLGEVVPADFDGDGKSDVLVRNGFNIYVFLSTGSGFLPAKNWGAVLDPATTFERLRVGDFNGDGKADLLQAINVSSGIRFLVSLSTGGSFGEAQAWATSGVASGSGDELLLADFNGDGLTDVLQQASAGLYVLIGRTGFDQNGTPTVCSSPPKLSGALRTPLMSAPMGRLLLGDVDGDGCTDVLLLDRHEYVPAGAMVAVDGLFLYALLFQGSSFQAGVDVTKDIGWIGNACEVCMDPTSPHDLIGNGFLALGDFDGDGRSDCVDIRASFLDYLGSGPFQADVFRSPVRRLPGGLPDVVAKVTTSLGGTFEPEYAPSSAWPYNRLPVGMVVQTVAELAIGDGRGNTHTYWHQYERAVWAATQRRFLGFGITRRQLNASGDYEETYFHQHADCFTKPAVSLVRNADGMPYASNSNTYGMLPGGPPYECRLNETWRFEYSLTASGNTWRSTSFTYDDYGNVVREYEEWSPGGATEDHRTITRQYRQLGTYTFFLSSESVYNGYPSLLKRTTWTPWGTTAAVGSRSQWDNTTGADVVTGYEYDGYGNLTSESSPRDSTWKWRIGYDTDTLHPFFPVSRTNPLEHVTRQAWDYVLGRVKSATDENGNSTSFAYDKFGRVIQQASGGSTAAALVVTYQYHDQSGNSSRTVTRTTGGQSLQETERYDGLGRVWRRERSQPGDMPYQMDVHYDEASPRPSSPSAWYEPSAGESAVLSTYFYDGLGRVVMAANPDGTYREIAYTIGSGGYLVRTEYDELRHWREFWMDGDGRVRRVLEVDRADATPGQATYEYDPLGSLVGVTDPNGNVTTLTWDSLGRRTRIVDPDLGTWRFEYDRSGNLTKQTDAKSQLMFFSYDRLDRVITKQDSSDERTYWYYDETSGRSNGKGRLTTVMFTGGRQEFSYDAAGNVSWDRYTVDNEAMTFLRSHDGLGRLRTLTYPAAGNYPSPETVTYTYDDAGRLARMRSSFGFDLVGSILYDARDQIKEMRSGDGHLAGFAYDPQRLWLTSARVTYGTSTRYDAAYGYYADGRTSSIRSGTNTWMNMDLWYDNIHRLTHVSYPNGSGRTEEYRYDPAGNMTYNSTVGAYQYAGANHRVTRAGTTNYAYDLNGNVTARGGQTLEWDAENRLTRISQTFQDESGPYVEAASFAYDHAGQRIKRVDSSETRLQFGGLAELVNGVLVKYYFAGSRPVAMLDTSQGKVCYYHLDHLGGVRMITHFGTITRRMDYAPFGKQISGLLNSSYSRRSNLGFTGHEMEQSWNLIYMRARYQDPVIGRFLSPDTIVPDWYNPQALNRYSYVYNDPISNVDPTGHEPNPKQPWEDEVKAWIEKNEGARDRIYTDSENNYAIGVGHDLGNTREQAQAGLLAIGVPEGEVKAVLQGEKGLSDVGVNIDGVFEADLAQATKDARQALGPAEFDNLPSNAKVALVDMSFNLGLDRLSNFSGMLGALRRGDFRDASLNVMLIDPNAQTTGSTRYATQVGSRAERNANAFLAAGGIPRGDWWRSR